MRYVIDVDREGREGRTFRDPQQRFFDDFEAGTVVRTRRRTIDAADLSRFAGLVGNYYPLHIDEELGRQTRFGARLTHGSFVLSLAIGLFEQTGVFGDAVVAMLEMNRIRALAPVLPGDTIGVVVTIDVPPQEEGKAHGVLALDYAVINHRDEEAMRFEQRVLVRRRP